MSSTSVKIIKRRIRSAKNIKQITKAMEMVSASKMRKAQQKALSTRPYSIKLKEILSQLRTEMTISKHPMLSEAPREGLIAIILVSSNRGLCGALNTNLFRTVEDFMLTQSMERPKEVINFEFITVGKKSREYVLKSGYSLHAEFSNLPENLKFEDVLPISRLAVDGFNSERFREIYLIYTDFISTLSQEVTSLRLIPVEAKKILEETRELHKPYREYIFEPNTEQVLEFILPHYIEMQVYHSTLEALASEQSARMVAMRNASDNATEITSDLTLILNKQRQQSITNEISDLITSRMAVP